MYNLEKLQIRDAFIYGVIEQAQKDRDVVFISNDFGAPALDDFRENFPAQFINAGISEQNIVSVAAGLACEGKKVFVYSIASFISLRCFEQLKLDVCVHNAPVTIMAGGGGLAYAEDGPTHHALEDIAVIRTLAGMEIYSPSDAVQTHAMAQMCVNNPNPAYVRLDKGLMPVVGNKFAIEGSGYRATGEKNQILVVATGYMLHRALEVADLLSVKGIACDVVDLYQIKPLSSGFVSHLQKVQKVITLEEHTLTGGVGTIIAEQIISNSIPVELTRFAIPEEKLYVYGVRDQLHKDFGLDTETLVFNIAKCCQ